MKSQDPNHLNNPPSSIGYRGRFAPSPSGPLHFGSLVAALGSWLDAKANDGEWLLRMEDIDPPREIPGAADDILRTLERYGLYWDQQVTYQSNNLAYYQHIIDGLKKNGLIYQCNCTRKKIKQSGGIYLNVCRDKNLNTEEPHSLRLIVKQRAAFFNDLYQGKCQINPITAKEDFILKRKDGLFAYMLAVVADDREQQINHVIRGVDLLDTTDQQLYLFDVLNSLPFLNNNSQSQTLPSYGHLPLVVDKNGLKLSKQNHASAITESHVSKTLWQVLMLLKQNPPDELSKETKEVLLDWAIDNWQPSNFKGLRDCTLAAAVVL
jgi:glutamyl-Q tRNA(Asp) synthetase